MAGLGFSADGLSSPPGGGPEGFPSFELGPDALPPRLRRLANDAPGHRGRALPYDRADAQAATLYRRRLADRSTNAVRARDRSLKVNGA
jgi:hypothetical protein